MSDDTRPPENGWLPDTPVDDTVLRRFVHNQGEMNDEVARAVGGRAARTDGVFLADAQSPVPYYNQAVLARPLEGPDDPVLDDVASFFDGVDRAVTMLSVFPAPDLSARGWTLMGHPMFVARAPGPHEPVQPPDVELRRAETPDELAVAERVAIEGYPLDHARDLPVGSCLPPGMLGTGVAVRVGRLGGEPVAVGNSYVHAGVVNLCLAATLPAARRRGVWNALVWARVDDGPDLPAVAFTSDYSRPGFVRMGFLPITRFTLWIRTPSRAARH
jgi:hypothetical protein